MPDRDDDLLVQRIAAELRGPVITDPRLDARIMAAVRAEPLPRRGGPVGLVWSWLREPRTVRLSPLAGLAAAAGLVALVLIGLAVRDGAPPQTTGRATHVVQFVYVAPLARTVSVVGDFNDWDPGATPLRAAGRGGLWTATVALPVGRHRYTFLVDGVRWVADPAAPPAADDAFGTPNSVVTVGT